MGTLHGNPNNPSLSRNHPTANLYQETSYIPFSNTIYGIQARLVYEKLAENGGGMNLSYLMKMIIEDVCNTTPLRSRRSIVATQAQNFAF